MELRSGRDPRAYARALVLGTSLTALLAASPALAGGVLPTGGQVTAGQATIGAGSNGLVIDQASGHAIVNWQNFSIGAGNAVKFNNGSGATLNRVTGGNLSQIDGVLKATGSVYLINPQGVVVGPGGKVITGGSFIASTRDVDNDAFMKGGPLHATGTSNGAVINQGKIVSRYGDTILIGKSVSNSGIIKASRGTAGLAAGDDVTLRPMDGDARISISAGKGDVTNTGTITAAQAELNAAGGNVYAVAGNQGGITVTGTKTVGGRIWLTGGDTTEISGAVTATNKNGSGGTIIATAPNVVVNAGADISASGTKGGTVLLGGDEAGGSDVARKHVAAPVATAKVATVASGAKISADGSSGTGGAVVVWSDDQTSFHGAISAVGAGQGDGGFAEVSSHGVLDYAGITDLTAANGHLGTLLLDPNNLTISTSTTSNAGSSPNYSAGAASSVLKASDLTTALASANISVSATGTLTVSSVVAWTAATTLTLTAGGELTINAAVTNATAGSGLTLVSTAADIYLQSGTINVGTLTATAATQIGNASGTYTNAAGTAIFNAGTAAGIGNSSYGVFSWTGTITASNMTLNAQGWVYPAFTIKAANLLVTGGGTFNLYTSSTLGGSTGTTTAANVIGTLAANVTGTLYLSDNSNLVIGTVNGVNGITASTFDLVTSSGKTTTQAQAINATNMALSSAAGTVTLTNTDNVIGNFAGSVSTGTMKLYGKNGLVVAGQTYDYQGNSFVNGITAGTLTLGNTGTVTQSGKVAVTNLELLGAGGNYQLTNTSNTFTTLAANTGSVNVSRSSSAVLKVGTVNSTVGITATGAVTLTALSTNAAGVTVSNAINAGGGVTLTSAGGISVAANINATNSSIGLRPDSGGTGSSTNTAGFTGGAKASTTGTGVTSIYYNAGGTSDFSPYIDSVTGNGNLRQYLYINTLQNLQDVANNPSGSYALNKDIDASATATWNSGAGFSPIGQGPDGFTGNFDGLGHSVSNLTIYQPAGLFVGLFSRIGLGAGVANLVLSGGNVTGYSIVGALAGQQDSAVSNIISSVNVTGTTLVGGLAGKSNASITSSYATGNVTASGDYVGGLAGYQGGGTISQSYATGKVTGGGSYIGGLIGYQDTGSVVTSSYWDTTTTGLDTHSGAGNITDAFTGGLTSAQFATASNFTGWTFGTTAGGSGWVIVDADSTLNNAGGAAGATRPMMLSEASANNTINNAHQLQLMALNLAGNYTLGSNIDMSETASASGVWLSAGFLPIGYATTDGTGTLPADTNSTFPVTSAKPFSGNFNGSTFTISNLTINRPTTDYVGLIGYAYNSVGNQTIKNVNLVGGSITGRDHVGSIMGGNRGAVDNVGTYVIIYLNDTTTAASSSSATVNGHDFVGGLYGSVENDYSYFNTGSGTVSGRDYVGGVVGWLNGGAGYNTDLRSSAVVSGRSNVGGMAGYYSSNLYGLSYASGNVTATGDNVGGLIGYAYATIGSDGTYASGNVIGNNNVGGLVGANASQVSNAFATGSVTGVTNVGGLVGTNDIALPVSAPFVDLSFATGVVHGVTNVGGLVGYNSNVIGSANGGNYATGAVYGTTNVGGLIGANTGDSTSTYGKIITSYATGYVSGTTNVGGLVGSSTVSGASGYVKSSYFNSETSGSSAALGSGTTGTGGIAVATMVKTTAQLQAALQTGFATAAWGIVANTSLPYFKWLYSSAPQVVSGTAYTDRGITALKGAAVNMQVSGLTGTARATVASMVGSTGANGLYSFLVPNGTFAAAGKQVLVYDASAATFNEKTIASLTGLSLYGTYFKEQATSTTTTLSGLTTDLALAVNGNAAVNALLNGLANREIDAAAAMAIDQAISTGTLVLNGTGAWTQSAAINATNLLLLGTGGNYTLTNPGNAIGSVAANTGTVTVVDNASIIVGSVAGTVGVTTTGAATVSTNGDLTIAASAKVAAGSNNNVVLAVAGNFINSRGSDAVSVAGSGRWLIYSNAPGGDTFGALNSGNTAVWNGTSATLAPGSVTQGGNRYIFAYQPTLTITTTNATKIYGDTADVSAAYSLSGFQAGVTNAYLGDAAGNVYSGTPSITSMGAGQMASISGGPYAITAAQGTLTALNGYGFSFQNSGLLTITPMALTVAANSGQTKVYGDVDPVFGYSLTVGHLVGTDTLTGALSRDVGEDVGGYAINQGSLAASANYSLSYTGTSFAITPMALTVTANSGQTKVYGDVDPVFGYSLTVGHLAGTDTLTGALSRDVGEDVGGYAINQGSLAASANYTLSYTAGTSFSITPMALTVTANSGQTKVYGDVDPVFGYSLTVGHLVGTDTLTGALSRDVGEDVGGYAINQGSLAASANYTFSYTTGTSFSITPMALTVSATSSQTKVYGDTDPVFGYSITTGHMVGTDTLSGALSRDAGEDVGGYAINQGSLAASANYTLSYTAGTNFNITPMALTVSATSGQTKVYGDVDPVFGYSITGGHMVGTDTLSGALSRDTGEDVGNYAINQGSLAASANYTLSYTAGTNFAITPMALTVSATAGQAKVYGDVDPVFGYSITTGHLVGTDTLSGALTRDAGEDVNSYAITQGSLASSANYTLSYAGTNFAITPMALTVSATAGQAKVYGDVDPVFGYSITTGHLVGTDTLSGALTRDAGEDVNSYAITQGSLASSANYTLSYAGTNFAITPMALTVSATAGQSKVYGDVDPSFGYGITTGHLVGTDTLSGTLSRDTGEDVGAYAINQGSLAASANYTLSYTTGTSFAVTPMALTVAANSGQTKVYGDANPALGYSITAGRLVGTDALSGALTRDAGENVNAYAINQGSLASSANYTLSYATGTSFAITPMALTVSADSKAKVYGTLDPAGSYVISGGHLVGADTLTGALTRDAGENVGAYAITRGTLNGGGNYTLAFVPGTLSITPAALTITAGSGNKIYGDTASLAGFTASGLVRGDQVNAVALASNGTVATANVGSYAVAASGAVGSGLGNYVISYNPGVLIVTPRALIVTIANASAVYGAARPVFTASASGLVNGDTLSGTPTATGTHVGSYAITPGTLAASANYVASFRNGTFIITPANLAISANNIAAQDVSQAQPTATFAGLVNGDSSAVVSGLQFGLFPVTGTSYDVVPFGASAADYTIVYVAGVLTVNGSTPSQPTLPSQIALAIPPQSGSASGSLTIGGQTFVFSNAATSAISGSLEGGAPGITLFQVGLPGHLSGFTNLVVSDYSNATGDSDRLATE